MALGRGWIYQGIRRVDSAGTVSRDSIRRAITVKSGISGSSTGFILTLVDSLYARLRADKPLEVEEMAFPDGPRSVVVYAERSPGILVDTSVYAEEVGLVRRAKTLNEGRVYTEEFRLIGFQGKPFQAMPVSLAAPAAQADRVMRGTAAPRPPVRVWRGRDAAGKARVEKRR